MFEQRNLCNKLPQSFNSITVNNHGEQCINKRHRIIQDFTSRVLNVRLKQYEIKIQHYDYWCEQELTVFKCEAFRINSSYQMCHFNILIHFLKVYLYHHTKILIHPIRYKESCFHIKF